MNVNDAAPVCTPSASRLEVPEDASVGVTLLSLSCQDPDSASLQYTFTEPSTTGFQISQSGELSLGVVLDYETQPLYILSVSVSDGEFTTNTTIYLTVTGVNEHAPIFATPTPDCSIAENSIRGSPVCSIQASDADSGDDDSISFDFMNPTTVFEIDPSTGDIYVVGDIDFETAPLHSLVVRVTDGGDPALTNEIAVNVTVRDENDHSPQVPPYTPPDCTTAVHWVLCQRQRIRGWRISRWVVRCQEMCARGIQSGCTLASCHWSLRCLE